MRNNISKKVLFSSLAFILSSSFMVGCSQNQPKSLTNLSSNQKVMAKSITRNPNAYDFREESIYFVMTDRFVDGDQSNNNVFGDEYRPGQLTFNQGGDFKGLIENLDYIKEMGFTAIWVTPPIMQPPGRYLNDSRNYEASGYHGYWAWDFSKIDPHLESQGATYQDFIKACHSKNIKVVQDIVTNHGHGTATAPEVKWHSDRNKVYGLGQMFDIGNDSDKWFNHGGAQIADLMDFNDKNEKVIDWFSKIYESYQNMGVDSFRIDTVAWMEPNFWTKFTDRMHKNKKDFFMFGEVWTNGDYGWLSSYTQLGSLTADWPMNNGLSVLDMPGSAMNTWGQLENTFKDGGDYNRVDSVLQHDFRYKDATYLVSYLDNHDKPRFNGTGGDGRQAGTTDFIDALNWYFTSRGIPCIYYGTEVQMQGGNDPDNRRVLGRDGISKAKQNPVYNQLKKMNAVRKSFLPLQKAPQVKLFANKDSYGFKRTFNNETAIVLLNKGGGNAQLGASGIENGQYVELYTGEKINVTDGNVNVNVNAHGVKILAKGNIKGTPWTISDWTKTSGKK